MRLFHNIFSKKEVVTLPNHAVVSPVSGKMINPTEISDNVFSQELLGQTIGFQPSDSIIVAPFAGTIEVFFETGHAFALKSANGTGILVHVGIDTVSLNGNGFQKFAHQGDYVEAGQKILEVDFNKIRSAGLDPTVMLILTEQITEDFKFNYIDPQNVVYGQIITK